MFLSENSVYVAVSGIAQGAFWFVMLHEGKLWLSTNNQKMFTNS